MKLKTKNVFSNKNFMLLFLGKIISQLGDSIYLFATSWYILEKTGSTVYSATLALVGVLPVILVMPFGGAIADRVNRKKVIVFADLIRGIELLLMVLMFQLGSINISILYFTAIVLGVGSALFSPAASALIPNIVEEEYLTKTNSLMSIVNNFANVIGILFSGLLYALMGIKLVFLVNGLSFIFSSFCEMMIKVEKDNREKRDGKVKELIGDIVSGYSYLKNKKDLFLLFKYFVLVNLITSPIAIIYLPYIFNRILKVKPIYLSYVQIGFGAGCILSAVFISSLLVKKNHIDVILKGLILEGVFILTVAIPISPILFDVLSKNKIVVCYILTAIFLGGSVAAVNVNIQCIYQKTISDNYLGRVSGLLDTLTRISMPIGYLFGGVLARFVSIYLLILITAVILLFLAITMHKNKEIKSIGLKGNSIEPIEPTLV